ncbi:hypothetical protein PR048_011939 [Dryococelus australis]|uniref:Uncharacterized protein n=1 Tax=Dryococelus australis TaxID=614101 RepID=A0ABQ9HN17_9NEOP|nr:hypothetical protein PR048_011939 [Dryococelus australis]
MDEPDFEPNKDDSFGPDSESDPEVAAENKRDEQPENEILKRNQSHRILPYTYDHRNDLLTAKLDQRGKKTPPNKTPEMAERQVKNLIESLSTVPSHYCRSDSKKLYLPYEFKNKANVYRIYQNDFCSRKGITPVTEKNQYNIGIHSPKKDKCIICEGSTEYDTETESYAAHFHEKKLSLSLFKAHQVRSKQDSDYLCASFDLQRVLNTPLGDNITLFSILLSMKVDHTMDIVTCGANEMGSRLLAKSVPMCIHTCACLNITYLLPGHTYMPGDFIHSIIESNYRKKIIWAPSEWLTIIPNSRINPKQYEVNVRTYKDFQDWKGIQGIPLISTCQMHIVRRATIQKKETHIALFRSYGVSRPPQNICLQDVRRISSSGKKLSIKTIYTSPLPVSAAKKKDLVALCKKNVILTRYHSEFLTLPANIPVENTFEDEDSSQK